MVFKLELFLIMLHASSLLSLNTINVCILPGRKHSLFLRECNENSCQNQFSYECGPSLCSTDQNECDSLKRALGQESESEEKESSGSSSLERDLVKKSADETMIDSFNPDDVCINGVDCFSRKIIPLRSRTSIKVLKRVDCQCVGHYGYPCGREHCAVDSSACSAFEKRKFEIIKKDSNLLKKCGNSKHIY